MEKNNKMTYEIPEAEVVVISRADVLSESPNALDNLSAWKWDKNI